LPATGRAASKLGRLFDHVTLRASDGAASTRFYELVLATLGVEKHDGDGWTAWGPYEFFVLEDPGHTRRLHIAFTAPTHDHVHAFWNTGIDAGYESDGEPGPRPQYGSTYYGGFLLDPDGNSAEAVHHDSVRERGPIDHMWLRVADVEASTRFYEKIAESAGLYVRRRNDDRTQIVGETGSFSVVSGAEPTENVHIAFPARDNATVDEFHRVAIAARYRDNGGPGERKYHAGYYAAFVLDPDGNNIEVVNHNRR
jgi:catechol 2,3-dioxygenase-like lactoylglutathione lyase family enzyme